MKDTIDGKEFKEMFVTATNWLEKLVPDINALNVYPVPDGDCGTNMLFTMRASLAEASRSSNGAVSSVAGAMAKGALMGARGNSGVILSQIWRGLANSLNTKQSINGKVWAEALSEASRTAYGALSNPVEGTILTVIKESAAAACRAAENDSNLVTVWESAVNAAKLSVQDTPNLLPVLKDAGVVDAGGHGIYTLFEGALLYIKQETNGHTPQLIVGDLPITIQPVNVPTEEEDFGYCTQFLINGDEINIDSLRDDLQCLGKSLIVVGDQLNVRVHIHSLVPDDVRRVVESYGEVIDTDIRNMDDQHKDFLLMQRGKMDKQCTAVVAVVNGDGLANVFSDLGISAIVPGGQTMNPSTMDLLQAVEVVPADDVIILPNNKNIIPTANQVQYLTKKHIKVIPTESIPQGVTAMVAFSPEMDFKTNSTLMEGAFRNVRTIEITHSTRTGNFDGVNTKEGQFIAILDGKLVAASDEAGNLISNVISMLDLSNASIVTVYYSEEASAVEVTAVQQHIRQKYPILEVEVLYGGQPHYDFVISVE